MRKATSSTHPILNPCRFSIVSINVAASSSVSWVPGLEEKGGQAFLIVVVGVLGLYFIAEDAKNAKAFTFIYEQIPMKMTGRIPLRHLSERRKEKLRRTIFSCLLWLSSCCRSCRLPVFFQYRFPGLHKHSKDHGAGSTCM